MRALALARYACVRACVRGCDVVAVAVDARWLLQRVHVRVRAVCVRARAHAMVPCFFLTIFHPIAQRVVTCVKKEKVGGLSFVGYGAHMDDYPVTYLSFACAIGIT